VCAPVGDEGPWELALYILAMAHAGVASLTLVLGMRWQLRTKRVAALPGLATLALAGAVAIGDAGRAEDRLPMVLVLSIELAAVAALIAISAWQPEIHGRGILRLVVVLWGTTALWCHPHDR
jgi:hypothetical protein